MKFRKKIGLTLTLVIVITLGLKCFLPPTQFMTNSVNNFWIKKTFQAKKYDIVVGGDSRIYRGFDIPALTNNLKEPLSAYNFGYSSAGYSEMYLDFLQDHLQSNSTTPIMILGVTPHSLTEEAGLNKHLQSFQSKKGIEVYKAIYFSEYFNFFNTYQPVDIFHTPLVNYRQDYRPSGWVASHKIKEDTLEALESYEKTFSDYQVSEEITAEFIQQVKEIRSSNIQIIAFRPPSSDAMRALEDSISGFDEGRVKKELLAAGAIWIDLNDEDFDSYDGSHLHYKSAEKLSREIANKINELLPEH